MTVIFAAEGVEARVLYQALELHTTLDGPWVLHQGQVGIYPVVLLEANRGKVAAAAAVAYMRQRFNPSQAFWMGVAKALNPELKPLDLVIAPDAVQYDVDFTALGHQPGELPTSERFIAADTALSARVLRTAQGLGFPVHMGRVASADRLLTTPEEANALHTLFAADAAEMEGAAALWTARRMGLPMALVQIILEDQAWSEVLQTAYQRLAALVAKVLESW